MKKILAAVLFSFALCGSAYAASDFTVTSPNVEDGKPMTKAQELYGFDCSGDNVFPGLTWQNPPLGTQSYAVTVFDPDAKSGKGWWHFSVFNIPADVMQIASSEGKKLALPKEAVLNKTDFDFLGFGGACPPVGDNEHHYRFTVYALAITRLDEGSNLYAPDLLAKLQNHILGKAELVALYKRAAAPAAEGAVTP